ncbi:TIGR01213 family protein [Dictyocaulus viviparus]|uniref:tRNA pseudouridine(55) synthase n=1 Tax=Dictyocaulus viviparus TaxID=29172 RepID=A0A0D8XLD4_DICVI|nr:TIGR01213 family protein [Dictyocaulus viviparus]
MVSMNRSCDNNGKVPLCLCTLCQHQVAGDDGCAVKIVNKSFECVLCFGILDPEYISQVAKAVEKKLEDEPYDATACTLALSLPISQVLRDTIIRRSRTDLTGILLPVPCKIRIVDSYLPKLRESSKMRFALATELKLNITFENNEFIDYDTRFLLQYFPEDFKPDRKRKFDESSPYTKVKVERILGRINEDIAKEFTLSSPTRFCSFSISFEREPVFLAGRYCKYSRFLPQSPWSFEDKTAPKEPGNSVSEKICDSMKFKFGASEARFIASGREDIDVRMLGDGRPFAVELRNCHFIKSLEGKHHLVTLRQLQNEINKDCDIRINGLARITNEEIDQFRIGEEKRKVYVAYCYSTVPIHDELLEDAVRKIPTEILQKTPIRVLKRRALLDRRRSIYSMEFLRLDNYHFLVRLETQAGTYVKEFVHGDFGRTRPSLADILNISQGGVDILELDVEKVDFDWPPTNLRIRVFKE